MSLLHNLIAKHLYATAAPQHIAKHAGEASLVGIASSFPFPSYLVTSSLSASLTFSAT